MNPSSSPAAEARGMFGWLAKPATAYVAPFVVFLVLLGFQERLRVFAVWESPIRFLLVGAAILVFSRRILDFKVASPLLSICVGSAVFLVWILPELLWPAYRSHWLFQNALFRTDGFQLAPEVRASWIFLSFRVLRAALIVPIVEELFWRGWLLRWLVRHDFENAPIGSATPRAFWLSAFLFAVEHGSYWEVGFLAGATYNWLLLRTRRLGDCMLAHAVTNAVLSAYVIWAGKWQYWP